MGTSIRIVDYHLKERIEGQNSKITLSGRNRRRKEKFAASARFWRVHLPICKVSQPLALMIMARKKV